MGAHPPVSAGLKATGSGLTSGPPAGRARGSRRTSGDGGRVMVQAEHPADPASSPARYGRAEVWLGPAVPLQGPLRTRPWLSWPGQAIVFVFTGGLSGTPGRAWRRAKQAGGTAYPKHQKGRMRGRGRAGLRADDNSGLFASAIPRGPSAALGGGGQSVSAGRTRPPAIERTKMWATGQRFPDRQHAARRRKSATVATALETPGAGHGARWSGIQSPPIADESYLLPRSPMRRIDPRPCARQRRGARASIKSAVERINYGRGLITGSTCAREFPSSPQVL